MSHVKVLNPPQFVNICIIRESFPKDFATISTAGLVRTKLCQSLLCLAKYTDKLTPSVLPKRDISVNVHKIGSLETMFIFKFLLVGR